MRNGRLLMSAHPFASLTGNPLETA